MPDPINYTGMQIQADPAKALLGGLQAGAGIQQVQFQQQQQQAALDAQRRQQADMQALMSKPNPTAEDYANYTLRNPTQAAAAKQAFWLLDEAQQRQKLGVMTPIFGALQSGRSDLAKQLIDDRITALQNGGNPADLQATQVMKQVLDADPKQAARYAGLTLASLMGPDKFAAAFPAISGEQRASELQPYKVAEAQGTAAVKQAEGALAPDVQASDLAKKQADIAKVQADTANVIESRGLDRANFELKYAQEMKRLSNPELNAGMQKMQADSVASSLTAMQSGDRAVDLAAKLRQSGISGGVAGRGREMWNNVFGSQDEYTALKKEFVAMRNQGMLGMLPPGPASDKDIEMVKSGFPSDNANAESMAKWLDAYSNVQKASALREQMKADWINSAGGLGNTPREVNVGGVHVPKGTSFVDFVKSGQYSKVQAANEKPAAPANDVPAVTTQPSYFKYGK